MSHSSRDSVEALALKTWLERAEPGLVGEVVVDLDPDTGIPAGVRWKEALRRANARDRLRSAAHPAFSVETGLRIWPRLRPTDRLGRG